MTIYETLELGINERVWKHTSVSNKRTEVEAAKSDVLCGTIVAR